MEMCESFSRAFQRRRYRRLEIPSSGGFVVQPKRVKVVHFEAAGGIVSSKSSSSGRRRRRTTQRLQLRGCFRVLVPRRLMAAVKAAAVKLLQVGRGGNCNSRGAAASIAKPPPPKPVLMLPSDRPLRSSSNDVIDEVWLQNALRRSIAEGRLPI